MEIQEKNLTDEFGNIIQPGDKIFVISNEPDEGDFIYTFKGVAPPLDFAVYEDENGELFFTGGRVYKFTETLYKILQPLKAIERYNYLAKAIGAPEAQLPEKYGVSYRTF